MIFIYIPPNAGTRWLPAAGFVAISPFMDCKYLTIHLLSRNWMFLAGADYAGHKAIKYFPSVL
jgi:hypothetical protein